MFCLNRKILPINGLYRRSIDGRNFIKYFKHFQNPWKQISQHNVTLTSLLNVTCSRKFPKSYSFCISEISLRKFSNHTDRKEEIGIEPKVQNETKPKVHVSNVSKIFALAKPEIWTLTGGIALLTVSSSITMAVPFAIGHIIDIITLNDADEMIRSLNRISNYFIGLFVTGGLANFGRVYLMSIAGQRIIRRLRSTLFASILRQEVGFFDENRTGELVNRLSADAAVVTQAVTMNISDGLRSLVMASAGVGMMFYVSTKLAIVGLSIVPPVAIMATVYGKYLRRISKEVQDTLAKSTQLAEEKISNIRTVRAFAKESLESRAYDGKVADVLHLTYKESLARGIFFGLTGLSGNVIILSVLYYGGTLVADSSLTVGHLSSFLMYAGYVGIAMSGLSSFYSEMNRGIGASSRIFELMERVPSIPVEGGKTLPLDSFGGNISFKNVSFAYPTRPDRQIFNNFNLEVASGSVTALVGSSGSGKSSVGSLLLRMYDPQQGKIMIDSVPLCQMNPSWLRSVIASVSQEPALFSTTIRENIVYGSSDPSTVPMDDVVRAASEANALTFIDSLPDRFDTIVGERGILLSGGQKQRVAIARAIIANPKILLLDEATSALDAESESLVQEALERLMNGKTVITIAHRLSTIRNADQIAVLHDGQIVEIGTYAELLQFDGAFKRLIERQTTMD